MNQFRLLPRSNTVLHAGRIATRPPREPAVNLIRGRLILCPLAARALAPPVLDFWRWWTQRHRTSRRCKPAVLFYLRVAGTPVRVI